MAHAYRRITAWVVTYAAIIAVTSLIPTIPYPTGGGILPLSVALVVLAPLVLGVRGGILAAVLGGILGSFVSPAAYPFGVVDAFFIAVFPALCSAFVFSASTKRRQYALVGAFVLSGIFAELVPYVVPGVKGAPPLAQPIYGVTVAIFFVPWILCFLSPLGNRLQASIRRDDVSARLLMLFLGFLSSLMLWSLWQISLWAVAASFPPTVTLGLWYYALVSRLLLAVIASILAAPLLAALRKSGLPAPPGVPWAPSNANAADRI